MKKAFFFVLIVVCSFSVFAQQAADDAEQYESWYEITVEIRNDGNTSYEITQCFLSGEKRAVTGAERDTLPVYVKVLCMGMVDQFTGGFPLADMTFEEEGMYFGVTGFSLSFVFKTTKTDDELLDEFGESMVERYRDRSWD
jgi:uncharacterized membrane protein YiaA